MLTFKPVQPSDTALINEWYADDTIGRQFVSFYRDASKWLSLLQPDQRWGFLVWNDSEPIGLVDLEGEGDAGWVAFYLRPASRGQGLGRQLVADLRDYLKDWSFSVLKASVEPDNQASLRILKQDGWTQSGTDPHGLIVFEKPLTR